ncbi:hypothetical protein NA56DRAFT_756046 [Hyaloscypha hepaticicola]|uniref:Uncharacterized protein n=1 Tax=Hyaloscypha hepaticicola TaxID=2082293 RepID=A0A2J6PGE0_9HELO|nr:hypothetical protein NA56DRAFT_756046 [Hyaloscypha hepaticicola]
MSSLGACKKVRKACKKCGTEVGQEVEDLLLGTHSLGSLSTLCQLPWDLKFSTPPSSSSITTPMSVLAAWISSRRRNSEAEACKRLQLFPLDDADRQLVIDVLCLQQWPEVQWQAMLSAPVKVQRHTAGTMNLEEWIAEKCIRKLGKLDQSFWVKDITKQDDEQLHDRDALPDAPNSSSIEGSEASHALRMTRTPGRFNDWDDIDWSESEESEEEEISESESQRNDGSNQVEDESYEEEYSDLEAEVKKFAPLVGQTPGLKDWLKSAQRNIKQLEKENSEQATKIQVLTDGLKEHKRKLKIAHKEQKTTTKLLAQREKELKIVHEEQKTNRKLLEQNDKELMIVRDRQRTTSKQAALELRQRQKDLDARSTELQKYQQKLLELSSSLGEYAGIVNSSGRAWCDLIYKPGMTVLDAISNVQRQYNNPKSPAFTSSYTIGPGEASGSSTPDRQKQQEHNLRLIRANQDLEKALSGGEVNSSEKAVAEIVDALDNIDKKLGQGLKEDMERESNNVDYDEDSQVALIARLIPQRSMLGDQQMGLMDTV